MELPTYIYNQMTSEDKEIVSNDFKHPVVIRDFYHPKSRTIGFEKFTKLFGNTRLPVEIYSTNNTSTTDADTAKMSMPKLNQHWKKDKSPSIYCAEVDLLDRDILDDNRYNILKTLENPNLKSRKVESLLLYLGNNHASGLHLHVNSDFILNQLYGSKTVYIFDNYANPNIHKNSFFQMEKSNFAKEDFFNMDHSKMRIYKVTLRSGDSLLIPPWCWHATQGHGVNTSITQTFDRKDISYLVKNPNLILDYFIEDYRATFPFLLTILILFLYMRIRARR